MTPNERTRHSYWFNFVYIFVIQGIGSGIVAGGIEFVIAYGMYWKNKDPVMLWAFPNTLSGDCALSLFIQVGITWALLEVFIGLDCYLDRSPLVPFDLKLPDKEKHKLLWYFFEIEHGVARDEDKSIATYVRRQFIRFPDRSRFYNVAYWLFWKLVVSMSTAAAFWAVVWPVTMGILAGIGTKVGSHDYMLHGWAPQITKLIFAFVLGLLSSPAAIIVILIRDKWFVEYTSQIKSHEISDEKINNNNFNDPNLNETPSSGSTTNSQSHATHFASS